jgi:hypothetical protein
MQIGKKKGTIQLPIPVRSVADPGCLSRIPDPDFYPSRIPDPKTATKERGGKKFDVILFTKLSKIWIWDPGSEIRDPEKTYSGSRIQGSKKHRIPQHCRYAYKTNVLTNNRVIG